MTGVVLTGTSGADNLSGGTDSDTVSGLAGADLLYGLAGNDSIDGGANDDGIVGGAGDDTIKAGTGSDNIWGEGGNDTFLYATGDGSDLIIEYSSATDFDVLKLTDINAGGIAMTSSSGNLLVTVKSNSQVITVSGHFAATGGAPAGIEQIQLADGTIYDRNTISTLVSTGVTQFAGAPQIGGSGDDSLAGTSQAEGLFGNDGNDTLASGDGNDRVYAGNGNDSIDGGSGFDGLVGNVGDDTINGGTGNDEIWGEAGNDTYLYATGDGNDLIIEYASGTEFDTLKFTDVNAGGLLLTTSSSNLLVTTKSSNQTITVNAQFGTGTPGVEQIVLADGTVYDRNVISALVSTGVTAFAGAPVIGGSGNDSLSGTSQAEGLFGNDGNDTLAAGDGNDRVYSGNGNDSIDGGAGFDGLVGNAGDDTIKGGTGNDEIWGEAGNDTYLYAAGDGNDLIIEYGSLTEFDTLKFTDVNAGGVLLTTSSGNLLVTTKSTSQVITVSGQFGTGSPGIEQLVLADGTTYDRTTLSTLVSTGVTAFAGAPVIGGSGNDSLSGTSQAEGLFGNDGNDTLAAGDGNDRVYSGNGNDSIDGGAGFDGLVGNAGDDTIAGETGNDEIWGEAGSDTYLYASGDGNDVIFEAGGGSDTDTLKLTDIAPGGIVLTSSSNNLVVTVKATNHLITVSDHFGVGSPGLERIQLSDGTIYDRAVISALVSTGVTAFAGAPVVGGSGADSLGGTSLAEGLLGFAGNDTLDGDGGADRLYGGDGNDSILGGAGDDGINGENHNDVIAGGTGNDSLWGDSGSDTFRYASGDGNDVIFEGYAAGDVDTLLFTDVNPGAVSVAALGVGNLIATVKATGGTITLNDFSVSSGGIYGSVEQFQFAGGAVWNRQNIVDVAATGVGLFAGAPVFGGSGNDSLSGTSQAEGLFGYAGADTLEAGGDGDRAYGGDGNDSISGGSGNDGLVGNAGDDTISGGAGYDEIWGEAGSDTFLYAAGDGNDLIIEGSSGSDTDILKFTDVASGGIVLAASGNDLLVTVKSTGETVTISGQYTPIGGPPFGIELIELSDSTAYDRTTINALASTGVTLFAGAPVIGGSANDSLTGTSQAEGLFGNDGNDTVAAGGGNDRVYAGTGNDSIDGGAGDDDGLVGNAGNDTIAGGTGADTMWGEAGSDVFVYTSGDGNDVIIEGGSASDNDTLKFTDLNSGDVSLAKVGNDLVITVTGTGETITVASHFYVISPSFGIEYIEFADTSVLGRGSFV